MRTDAIQSHAGPSLAAGLLLLGVGCVSVATWLQSVLSTELTTTTMLSFDSWQRCVQWLGGPIPGQGSAEIRLMPVLAGTSLLGLACWAAGSAWLSRRLGWSRACRSWAVRGWAWWCLPGAWELLRILAFVTGLESLEHFLLATPQFWGAVAVAGWLATFVTLNRSPQVAIRDVQPNRGWLVAVVLAVGIYCVTYTTLNWQLYQGLLVPHGDSAMYEEHLWNVTHGKGFRSYLDQGLFLGEHIQVIHLFLIPLHLVWPSHLLLEFCESLALASGALPVFLITRRHTTSNRAAFALSLAWLLYAPLQFLDISIDLKTFRPIGFGVPLMLLAIDQWERRHTVRTIILLLLTLTAKEEFSLVIGAFGVWIAVFDNRPPPPLEKDPSRGTAGVGGRRGRLLFGLSVAAFSVAYILCVTQIVIPWFRGGADVHYAPYFQKFGSSSAEVAQTLLTRPWLLVRELSDLSTTLYLAALLIPLAGVPLLAPSRCLVGGPLLILLCLNELSQSPHHHFHAPLLPIVFWAAAAGLANAGWLKVFWDRRRGLKSTAAARQTAILNRAALLLASTLACGLFLSIGPQGTAFWDSGSSYHWKRLYVPGRRAAEFRKIESLIPLTARVASTDFVHPRFTHHNRSYDYSGYRRKVSNYQLRVPDDTDYIVIDTRHPYSSMQSVQDIPDYQAHPERWDVLPDVTDGYFLVLKRRPPEPD